MAAAHHRPPVQHRLGRGVLRGGAVPGRLRSDRARLWPPGRLESREKLSQGSDGAARRRARLHPPHRDARRHAHRGDPVLRRRDERGAGRRLEAVPARSVPRARYER